MEEEIDPGAHVGVGGDSGIDCEGLEEMKR